MTLPTQTSTILYLLLAALVALAILFAATAAFFVLWSVFLLSSRFHPRTSPAWCKVLQRFGWHGKLKRASEASRIVLSQEVSGSLRNHDSDDARGLFFRLEAYSGLDESSSTWHVTVAVELRTSLLTLFVASVPGSAAAQETASSSVPVSTEGWLLRLGSAVPFRPSAEAASAEGCLVSVASGEWCGPVALPWFCYQSAAIL